MREAHPMAYELSQLRLEGMEVKQFIDCQICQKPGEHGELSFCAYVDENVFEEVESFQALRLYVEGAQEKTLFCGILTEMEEESAGEVQKIHVIVKSYTYLLDIEKKSRTFQDIHMTYSQLLHKVLNAYRDADCIIAMEDQPIGEFVVQYQETDWEFLKRILSQIYMPLSGEVRIPAIRIYAGVPVLEDSLQDIELKEIVQDFEYCDKLKEMGYEIHNADGIYCIAETRQFCELFASCYLYGKPLLVGHFKAYFAQGFFKMVVVLKSRKGIVEIPRCPMQLVGLALEGKVLDVKGESVRLHFFLDGDDSKDVYWFPYSTPSSSPDGSGWYYMPEVGDCLRVYFPTKHMKDVLAISAVSSYKGKDGPDRMADPRTKYLRTASGQEMNLSEKGTYLASSKDAASLFLGNDGKIVIKGQQVELIADEGIDIIDAKNINLHSKAGSTYQCSKGGKLDLDDAGNLNISGAKLNVD